ncbi:MAG: CidA/LrgA family protein [Spirochaetaceae bacterium]|nr:MAG: CidA/LrgA family protein [Spirochaetaceae bacterium]
MFGGIFYLFLFLFAGEVLSSIGLPLPGNVTGMLLMTGALATGILKPEHVRTASNVLLDNLAFLFVPPGVGIMVHMQLIRTHWLSISLAVIVSTILVLIVVGGLQQILGSWRRNERSV